MTSVSISLVIEGESDLGAGNAVARECGADIGLVIGRSGKSKLLPRLAGYNQAAEHSPWLVMLDLDDDYECAPSARSQWLPATADQMVFSIAVKEVEAWLLADAESIATFLRVSRDLIPLSPEELDDPKATLISIARRSRSRDIREGMVPRDDSGAAIGPTYVSDLNDFAMNHWRPRVAADHAPSLARCLDRMDALVQRLV